jgi:hypothetical protein
LGDLGDLAGVERARPWLVEIKEGTNERDARPRLAIKSDTEGV